jgi:UDP-N-acetylglucosamine 2-epimerase (non-hydrolysing)
MVSKVLCVAGARPNFMKIAPILRAIAARGRLGSRLVHTGQHYDEKLSKVFFEDLAIPRPDIELEVGSGSHATQTAEVLRRFEPVLEVEQPEVVLVVGDVNSTVACALAAAKFQRKASFRTTLEERARRRPLVVHVEAGLRSFDDDMPEEINRKATDAISDVLFVSEPAGMKNLAAEGVAETKRFLVGNVMIDTLLAARAQAMQSSVLGTLGVEAGKYGLLTLHRPSNVDEPAQLAPLLGALDEIAREMPLVFPVHPRTRARLDSFGIRLDPTRWKLVEPVGYLDFVCVMASAKTVFTDSGGVQEETTVLGVPCVTLRENTERPVTVDEGTNRLVGTKREAILAAAREPRAGARIPALWDGKAAARIEDKLAQILECV